MEQDWISVRKNLPTSNGTFIVCTSNNTVATAHFYTESQKFSNKNIKAEILFWMPLPKPFYHRERKKTDTLCWQCYKADHWVGVENPCPWAMRSETVEGWVAQDVGTSFRVVSCPLFEKIVRGRRPTRKED